MKIDSVSAYLHMKPEARSPCTPLKTFWMTRYSPPSPIPLVTYILNGWPNFQPKDKYEHPNIVLTEI